MRNERRQSKLVRKSCWRGEIKSYMWYVPYENECFNIREEGGLREAGVWRDI